MKDLEKINELIEKGYIIESNFPIKNINSESVNNFFSKLNLKTDLNILLDPSNDDAYLIVFRDLTKKFEREEIITSDKDAISKIKKQLAFENEPIGFNIHATCAALGNNANNIRTFYLNELIPPLRSVFGWEFKLNNIPGTFTAEIKIDSTNRFAQEKALNDLQNFLDALSVTRNVGFHIQHYSTHPIPKSKAPHVSGMGMWQHKIPPLSSFEAKNILEIMKADNNVKIAARGLNQAYVENLLPSRVARLWATIEHIFDTKPEPLFNKTERKAIIQEIKKMENIDSNKTNIEKINYALSNLHLKSRNERIAKNISILMKIPDEDAYEKVQNAALTRGKNVHSLRNDWKMLETTEKFLQEVLNKVIENR